MQTEAVLLCICTLLMTNLSGQLVVNESSNNVGIGTLTPSVKLDIPNHNDENNILEAGSFGISSFASNNGFLTHNCYFSISQSPSGAEVVLRESGPGALAQFFDGRIIYRIVEPGAAGSLQPYKEGFTIQNNGNMQIGYPWSNLPTERLEVNGNVAANGIVLSSDKNLKETLVLLN